MPPLCKAASEDDAHRPRGLVAMEGGAAIVLDGTRVSCTMREAEGG